MWVGRIKPPGHEEAARHRLPLGPVTVRMAAPREVVFDVIAGPYLGRTPRAMADKLRVVARGSDLVVADHYTAILGGRLRATTRETVAFHRPDTVQFGLLAGPVAYVVEAYRLTQDDVGTVLTYDGELASNLPLFGAWWARRNALTWVAVVRRSLADIKSEAERRAGASPFGPP